MMDIPLTDVIDIMDRKNAYVGHACFLFISDIILNSNGSSNPLAFLGRFDLLVESSTYILHIVMTRLGLTAMFLVITFRWFTVTMLFPSVVMCIRLSLLPTDLAYSF